MADHSIRISIDSSGAESGASRVARSLKSIQQEAAKAVGRGDGIKIGIDGSGAEAGAARVRRSLSDIVRQAVGLRAIKIGVDAEGAQSSASRVSRSLRDLQAQAAALSNRSISVSLDAAGMQESVNRVSRTIRSLADRGATVPVRIDAAEMQATVDRVSRSLREIGAGGSSVRINVDTTAAEAATQRIQRSLREVGASARNVSIGVDASGAEAGAARVNRSLRDIIGQAARVSRIPINMDASGVTRGADQIKRSLKDVQREAAATNQSMGAMANAGMAIRGALGGIAGAFGLAEISKQVYDATAKFQDLETRFKTLTGSAESAAETMRFLAETSNRLSVDTISLADSYSKLLPMVKDGVLTTQQARDMMIGLTDAQKATGATTAQLEQAMFGLAQTLAMPKANIEQLNQVTEPIPGLLGAMDRAVGKLYPTAKQGAGAMRELVEAGRVSSQVFRDITIKALQEFDGAAEKTAGNLSSQTQRMKNAWTQLLNTIGQTVDEPLSWLIDKITIGIQAIENGIRRLTSLGGALQESFDWTAPLQSIEKAWGNVTRANPSPTAVVQGPPVPPKAAAASAPAKLGAEEAKKKTKTVGERFVEDKRALEQQISTQKALIDAYDRGRPAVEQYRNAMSDLSAEQRLNSTYSREQSDALMGLMAELQGLQEVAAFNEQIGTMTEQISQIEGMASAYKEGSQAVRDAEAANKAYDSAVRLGMVGTKESVMALYELEQATQRANASLALAEEMFQMDIDISALERLVDSYNQGGEAVREAAIQNEVYATAVRLGVENDAAQVAIIDEKVRALRAVNEAQSEAMAAMDRGFDLEEMEGELRLSTMTGEARYIEAERLQMLMDKKRQLQDATVTLTAAEERHAEAMGRMQFAMQGQSTELSRLANSIPNMAVAFDQAAAGGLMHFEDALVDIITGAKSAKEAFADMAKAIAQDLARMAIRMAIIQPLAMAFGMPMFHTGGVVGRETPGMKRFPAFHTGGVAGGAAPMTRSLPPLDTWNKYHSGGLASNEVPAILQKGEGVFTKEQMAAMAPAGGGGNSVVNNINVSVPQGSGGGDPGAGDRQAKMIARQVQQAMDEHAMKNLRPGGIFNQSGY